MFLPSPKRSWDMRAWFLSLGLGNLAGLLLLCGGNPASRRFLETAFPYSAFGNYTGDFVVLLGLVLGFLIAPAVMTCLAKRLYALWGLLPICLLMLWLLAGKIVAHDVASFVDPVWTLPLVVLLCWGVSCPPISLFRVLRQRNRRPVASAPSLAPKRPLLRRVGLFALFIPLLALVILGWYNLKHPLHFNVEGQAHWSSGKEARVPLIKRGPSLYVKASLNGQEELCRVDTGASGVVWPRGLHIDGRLTSRRGQSCDVLGECVAIQMVVLPHLRIGSYEMTNLPTDMAGIGSGLFAPPQRPDAGNDILLGNPAFTRTVLTIDYKNAMLTIRNPDYDFMRQRRKIGDRVLEMWWETDTSEEEWERSLYGTSSVQMSFEGASFRCTLDTGWGEPEMGLTEDFVKRHPSLKQAEHGLTLVHATHSSAQVRLLHGLSINIPCLAPAKVKPISLTVNGMVTPTPKNEKGYAEGAVGLSLMQHYRITIDYQRGLILLEPYAQDAPGRRQEKTPPRAKQTVL